MSGVCYDPKALAPTGRTIVGLLLQELGGPGYLQQMKAIELNFQ